MVHRYSFNVGDVMNLRSINKEIIYTKLIIARLIEIRTWCKLNSYSMRSDSVLTKRLRQKRHRLKKLLLLKDQ